MKYVSAIMTAAIARPYVNRSMVPVQARAPAQEHDPERGVDHADQSHLQVVDVVRC
jgi:hypothetical protein